jgi:hypothetical protein
MREGEGSSSSGHVRIVSWNMRLDIYEDAGVEWRIYARRQIRIREGQWAPMK